MSYLNLERHLITNITFRSCNKFKWGWESRSNLVRNAGSVVLSVCIYVSVNGESNVDLPSLNLEIYVVS